MPIQEEKQQQEQSQKVGIKKKSGEKKEQKSQNAVSAMSADGKGFGTPNDHPDNSGTAASSLEEVANNSDQVQEFQ